MNSEECRDIARKYFALGVKSNSASEREQAIIQGEEWMTHWRYWTESMASLPAPLFNDALPTPTIPYRF